MHVNNSLHRVSNRDPVDLVICDNVPGRSSVHKVAVKHQLSSSPGRSLRSCDRQDLALKCACYMATFMHKVG